MRLHPGAPRRPDPSFSLAQYRQRAKRYDNELALFEPIRVEAVELLHLEPGQVVLDVGCGTGLSLGMLHSRVGPQGRIVGLDPSPEMLAQARKRVVVNGWSNVALVTAAAASAPLHGKADAAMFHFTHDVLRDDAAIAHVLKHLKPGARVVASGIQWAPPWAWPTNGLVLMAAMYSVSSLEGLSRPWDKLAAHLHDVDVRNTMFGSVYIVAGRYAPQ
jgi:SAM-dependent methyltransferase